jgi:hypothetical protein
MGAIMLKRILRRVVYFGIPVFMWLAGAACQDAQVRQDAPQAVAAYRCSRVGCDKRGQMPSSGAAPLCACGANMVLDYTDEDRPRLRSGGR